MPEERKVGTPGGVATTITPEEIRAAKKARFAQVVDRGYVNDRLSAVKLPDDKHGQWVRDDDMEITRMRILNYEVADSKTYGVGDLPLHGDGTKLKVGDVVFMVCSKEDHEIHDEIRRERFAEMYIKKPREGIQLAKNMKSLGGDVQFVDESTAQLISSPKDI